MAERVYCTYFDHNYLPRGLALYHSLQRHSPRARLWVLCLSEACYRALKSLDLPGLMPVGLADFEAADPDGRRHAADPQPDRILLHLLSGLEAVRPRRGDGGGVGHLSRQRPFLLRLAGAHLRRDEGRLVRHHSASLHQAPCAPAAVWNLQCRLGQRPQLRGGTRGARLVARTLHRVVLRLRRRGGDRFADQRYLNRLPGLFPNVHVIEHLGANLAPWNFAERQLEWRDGSVRIDGKYDLLFFHFHGVKRTGGYYFNSHRTFSAPFPRLMREHVYEPYVAALAAAEAQAAPLLGNERSEVIRKLTVPQPRGPDGQRPAQDQDDGISRRRRHHPARQCRPGRSR